MAIPFTPTWLYIKQHNKTGLKYFGKTTRDPDTYVGSGKYWKRHLRTHGFDVTTIWSKLFTEKDQLNAYAISFSTENNIVESKEWANLIVETGLDGGHYGPVSNATRLKMSTTRTGHPTSTTTRELISEGLRNSSLHEKANKIRSTVQLTIARKQCPFCLDSFRPATYSRWHGDNCKFYCSARTSEK